MIIVVVVVVLVLVMVVVLAVIVLVVMVSQIAIGISPISVVAPSKAWVCGHSLAGIAGANPTGGMDVCLLGMLCVVR